MKKKRAFHLPRVANLAGVTRGNKAHWLELRPPRFLIDTPGLFPSRRELGVGADAERRLLCLAAAGALPLRRGLPHERIAEHVLAALNAAHDDARASPAAPPPSYVSRLGLRARTDDLGDVTRALGGPPKQAAIRFAQRFRAGEFGTVLLDAPEPEESPRPLRVHRDRPIAYMNERALALGSAAYA